ncbi:MAG TPA: enoyl-CoA hydratase [Hyphomicrobiaceae bacterium]|nr:enoyl-CoA hydratase [Hyphomicrobiaceae bacterium]
MSAPIERHNNGGVLTVVNNNPTSRNAISPEFYQGFRDVLEEANADNSMRAIVLAGAGNFFCSGGNVNGLKERSESDISVRRSSISKLHAMIRAMRACRKPIIAAVEGGASGAGVALALGCDMVIAARGAYLSVAYVRIGLTPDGGTTALLGHVIPRQLLAEMVMTGDRIDVQRFHVMGVINQIVEPGIARDAAEALAKRLADGPANAIANGKRLVTLAHEVTLDQQLDQEAELIAQALGSDEGREGIAAFLEKRKPDFSKL